MKVDFGCGKNKREGFVGCDSIAFEGVDFVCDLAHDKMPFEDNTVEEFHASHFLEHLSGPERVHFLNELWRVCKPGAKGTIITPHWSHERAYGDPTHKFPPVCSWTYFYLGKAWRDLNAPHAGFCDDMDWQWSLSGVHDPNDTWVSHRNQETKQILMSRNINTVTDLIANLNKPVKED